MSQLLFRLRRMAATVAVIALVAGPVSAIETAGTVFVNVDAATFKSGDKTWANAGSYGLFDAVGAPKSVLIGGTPSVYFNGIGDAFVGRTEAPAGLTGVNPTRTIEAWVFNPTIASEETIVSWGKRGGGDGTNMAFNYGNHGKFGAVGHWGGDGPDVGWIDNDPAWTEGAPAAAKWHHLVYTYDGAVTRLYSDGELWNEEDTLDRWGGLDTHDMTPIAIASQWEADAVNLTGGLKGSMGIGRLRIHDGVLKDNQILANYNSEKAFFVNPAPPEPPKPESIPTGPIHRYSFSNAAGNATGGVLIDSVGGKNGTVKGDGATFTGSELRLPGGGSGSAAYGDLPNGLISKLTDATIESWVTIEGIQNWHRIFDFGSTENADNGELDGPGGGGAGLDYLELSATRGTEVNNHRLELRNEDPAGGGTLTVDFTDNKTLPHKALYTVVYDSDGTPIVGTPELRVYRDGQLMNRAATNIKLSDIKDVNNWLGRSNWTGDSNFEGKFDEFRIYDYALSDNQVLGNAQAGSEKVNIGGNSYDYNGDGKLTVADLDIIRGAIQNGSSDKKYDVDANGKVELNDLTQYVERKTILNTYIGDANLDLQFNTSDLVAVFAAGKYEIGGAANVTWGQGDWNADGFFNTGDLVFSFQGGGYESGPRAAVGAVPEPGSFVLLSTGMLGLWNVRRRRRS